MTSQVERKEDWQEWGWCALLFMLGVAAYLNSFDGPFIFDDVEAIRNNPGIRELAPHRLLAPTSARPVSRFTFALNYAFGNFNVRGFHLVNLLIHLTAGFVLYGLVRDTLRLDRFSKRYARRSSAIAFCVALIWLVHPLQTQAVTYLVQREESLMALFFLLCLYLTLSGYQSTHPQRWYFAAAISCWLGMGSKQVMVTAPFVVLLYDRAFLATSWRDLARRRSWMYAAMFVSVLWVGWDVVAPFVRSTDVERHMSYSAGFTFHKITPWEYLRSQPGVILHYLELAFWPRSLCLDYQWPVAHDATNIVPAAVAVGGLLTAAIVLAWCWPEVGFVGVTFFLILAPTSSVMPLKDLAFEHRMYLPLACVVLLTVLTGEAFLHWLASRSARLGRSNDRLRLDAMGIAVVLLVAGILCWRTILRNRDYRTVKSIWQSVLALYPDNPRANNNYGRALYSIGEWNEAVAHYRRAISSDPEYLDVRLNLARALEARSRNDEAEKQYREALRAEPDNPLAHFNYAILLRNEGRLDDAKKHFFKVISLDPHNTTALNNLADIHARLGEYEEAVRLYHEILRLAPTWAECHYNLATVLIETGDTTGAIAHLSKADSLRPDFVAAKYELARALVTAGRIPEAVRLFREILQLLPPDAPLAVKTAGQLEELAAGANSHSTPTENGPYP